MPNIDKHAPGSFSWIELATTDQPAAKAFYSGLFGWESADFPMGPDQFYTMFRLEGRDAAAGYTIHGPMKEQGVPPHWGLYIDDFWWTAIWAAIVLSIVSWVLSLVVRDVGRRTHA